MISGHVFLHFWTISAKYQRLIVLTCIYFLLFSRAPPGSLDLFFNSHHLMHVLVVWAVYHMHAAATLDLQWMTSIDTGSAVCHHNLTTLPHSLQQLVGMAPAVWALLRRHNGMNSTNNTSCTKRGFEDRKRNKCYWQYLQWLIVRYFSFKCNGPI